MRRSGFWIFLCVVSCFAIASFTAETQAAAYSENGLFDLPASTIPGLVRKAGLWDKPNKACLTKCEVFTRKDCFKELAEKHPAADPGSLQERCDDKFSVCVYDCMCDTCPKDQIIIKQP